MKVFTRCVPQRIETLVVSGGGMKGIASLGAAVALKKAGMLRTVKTYVGTSAGALVAAALATDRASLKTLLELVESKYKADIDLSRLLASFGLDSGKHLDRWISILLGGTYTFQDIYTRHGVRLIVCATNLTDRKPEYFSVDTSPTMDVALALRMSCCIPLYFSAIKEDGKVFVDGAVADNFPLAWASDRFGPAKVLGITFWPRASDPGTSLEEYVGALLECSTRKHYTMDDKRVLALDIGVRSAFEFGMSKKEMRKLYMSGYKQARVWTKKNV